jgi:hypothetical protein
MKISGFTFGRNATKLYYPVTASIRSILPIVDEFVVVLGDSDEDDRTREEVLSIGSPKIRIIDTVWDLETYPRGTEHAHQTDIAMRACSGDWLFYLQSDEVVHENDLPAIRKRCRELLSNGRVEGLLFDYLHFWGDYRHYHTSFGWYRYEIRIVRNDPDIHSWESAQSFRRIPDFDGVDYRRRENTRKLRVAKANVSIYHYGWVRPPGLMKDKIHYFNISHLGKREAEAIRRELPESFDYGPLNRLEVFAGTHPEVMASFIEQFDWGESLQASGKPDPRRRKHKHESFKYRFMTVVNRIFGGDMEIGGYRNYILLKDV